ncbi:MAG: SpoIIE family protein phosphatase [Gammaproteobacteria bacterium]|nr:SpoIIE family protein phosphatase [Gammaproteobacteria bacterium]
MTILQEETLAILARSDLFSDVSIDELTRIVATLEPVVLTAGSRVFSEGDAGDAVYIICTGTLRLEVDGMTLLERSPGQCVGEFALIDDKPRSATAIAIDEVSLLRWERSEFQRVLTSYPSVSSCVFKLLTTKLRENVRAEVELRLAQTRWQQDLARAREIQMGMLPPAEFDDPHTQLAGYCEPAHEVGGDFYDYLELGDGRMVLVICDVTGHGFYASLFVSMVKSALRTQVELRDRPDQLMRVIRQTLDLSLYQLLMSCCCVLIEPQHGRITYANAGHPPGLVYRTDGKLEALEPLDPILGALTHEESTFSTISLSWHPGDLLVLYTDGITEARDTDGNLLGWDFLHSQLRALPRNNAIEVRDGVLSGFERQRGLGAADDDVTLLVARACEHGG